MIRNTILIFFAGAMVLSCKSEKKENNAEVIENMETITQEVSKKKSAETDYKITPVSHATAIVEYNGKTIYIDPVGGIATFSNYKTADVVFITHGHGDHLDVATLTAIDNSNCIFVVPAKVAESLPESLKKNIVIMKNGEKATILDIPVEAIAMYNLREEALKFHPKGNGKGYVLNLGNERVYFSGDTEDTPEIRNLKNIDKAFVCMNLPYTMSIENAASAVLDFKPKEVYPYHYRGKDGLSDVVKFKKLVNETNPDINVIQWDWYPEPEN